VPASRQPGRLVEYRVERRGEVASEPLTTSSASAIAVARAKQNLDDADIGLLLQEMRGKAVPQRMNNGSRGSRRVRAPRAPRSHRQ
jgi:hypothetical protein